jgi:hypothetical protein
VAAVGRRPSQLQPQVSGTGTVMAGRFPAGRHRCHAGRQHCTVLPQVLRRQGSPFDQRCRGRNRNVQVNRSGDVSHDAAAPGTIVPSAASEVRPSYRSATTASEALSAATWGSSVSGSAPRPRRSSCTTCCGPAGSSCCRQPHSTPHATAMTTAERAGTRITAGSLTSRRGLGQEYGICEEQKKRPPRGGPKQGEKSVRGSLSNPGTDGNTWVAQGTPRISAASQRHETQPSTARTQYTVARLVMCERPGGDSHGSIRARCCERQRRSRRAWPWPICATRSSRWATAACGRC